MSSDQRFNKDPAAVLDYTIDWSAWLADDTISASSWSADEGITIDDDTNTTTTATVWISGGTLGGQYTITNHIVTAGGRTDERSIYITIVDM